MLVYSMPSSSSDSSSGANGSGRSSYAFAYVVLALEACVDDAVLVVTFGGAFGGIVQSSKSSAV